MQRSSMQSALRSMLDGFEGKPFGSDTFVGDDGLVHCSRCGTPRQVVLTDSEGTVRKMPCMCECMVMAEEEQKREEKRKRAEKSERARIRAAFPSEAMRQKTFDADDGKFGAEQMRKARAYANRFAETGGKLDYGLLFFGRPDSGKTFLSCCIANAALDAGHSVIMRSMPQLLVQRDDAMLDRLLACDLLVLDDLGAERSTSFGQEYVYAVVDGRYSARKPMVVSTNLTREELAAPADVMSARIYGRVLEACLPVEVETGRRRATRDRYREIMDDLGV